MAEWHLAELNVARAVAEVDGPVLAEFVGALEAINALADAAPGFVWRLAGADAGAPAAADAVDARLLLNLSVWTSPEALFEYVYKSQHTAFLVKRRQWFEKPAQAHMVLWWVPAGHRPTLAEAQERLEQLRRQGPSAQAFTFKERFPPPGSSGHAEDMRPEPYCSGWQ
jgi:Domain of unknown function (DUF3291)